MVFLRIADQEQRLVVGLANGRIATWLISDLVHNKINNVAILQPPSPGLSLLELAPNPSDRPELCIALYGASTSPGQLRSGTAISFDLRSSQWGSELKPTNGAATTSLCWSVKGKQIVLGLSDGSLAQISPEGEAKDVVAPAQGLAGSPYVEQVVWLENHAFLVTYNQTPSSEEPEHQYEVYSILRDTATKSIKYVHFTDPAPPFGDTTKRGHRFASWIKSWEPTKHMVFLANTSSTDVGLLGCLSNSAGPSSWRNLDLEDTSRPVLPFSSIDNSADTCPVGLELDFTAEDNVDDPHAANRGEDGKGKLDPMPILYIYTNDGLLLAYTVINVDSKAGRYCGMVKAGVFAKEKAAEETAMMTDGGSQSAAGIAPASSFGYPPTPAFGQSTGLGASFGSSTPAFGQSASIGAKPASPFSFNPSGSTGAAPLTFSAPASTGGFGAFAAKSSSAFGTPASAFSSFKNDTGTPSSVASAFAATSAAPPSVFGSTNASATPTSAFGQTSTPAFGSTAAFGSSSAFGQSSAFGAAATQKSPFATAASTTNAFSASPSAPSAGFGGFASKGISSFGSSGGGAPNTSSIFGSGGNLLSSTSIITPVFGQSLPSTAKPTPSAFDMSASLDMDDADAGGDSGSLSFGGLGGLLGDDSTRPNDNGDTKPTGFTFGDRQDATFSSMPTPAPFSFANSTSAKEDEPKLTANTTAELDAPVESAITSTTPSSTPFKEQAATESAFPSTTPSSSPLKEQSTPVKSILPSSTGTPSPLREASDVEEEASGDEEEEASGDEGEEAEGDETKVLETADLEAEEGGEDDWEEEEDGEDEEGEEEEEEQEEDGEGKEKAEEEEVVAGEWKGEAKEVDEEPVGAEEDTEAEQEQDDEVNAAAEAENKSRQDEKTMPKAAGNDKDIKVEGKSPTSFNFFPSQNKAAVAFEPPALALESTSAPLPLSSSSSSSSMTEGPLPTTSESPAPAQNTAKSSPFLNFSNRAPRSSSPLSGIPLNRADLPPSPDKGTLTRANNGALFASKAALQQAPSTFAPNTSPHASIAPAATPPVQQRSSLAKEATPKLSFSNAKVERKDVEDEGLPGIFLQTFLTMERELKVLTDNVKRCSNFQEVVREPNVVALGLHDLSDEAMWTFGELETKSKLTAELTAKADELSQETRALKVSLKEIQSQHLKVDVKREEIARFVRARNDPSFSKMVRVKQLGPEHAENQAKLRRATMSLRDGIEGLEAFLDKMKRIALEQQAGEAAPLRAPSLDTIRRTARNITQMAQLRLIELQEVEFSYDAMMQNKPVFMQSTNGTGLAKGDALDTMSSLQGALPSAGDHLTNGKGHFSAATAREMQKKHLDLKSIFKSGWKEPVLTRVASKREVAAADDYRLSDLDMAFAKGTIRVTDIKAPAPPVDKAAPAPAASMRFDGFKASNTGPPPFSFSPLPSTALPKDAFQLPPEQAPFAPGGSSVASTIGGRAHVSKFGGKRNTAVALPSAALSFPSPSGSDFFAMPATKSTSPAKPPPVASGGGAGGLGFSFAKPGGPTASSSSLTPSRLGNINLTFKGLQPMQPIAPPASGSTPLQVVHSGEDQVAYEEEEGEEEGERDEDDEEGDYEDEEDGEDEEGLSDVVEGEEE